MSCPMARSRTNISSVFPRNAIAVFNFIASTTFIVRPISWHIHAVSHVTSAKQSQPLSVDRDNWKVERISRVFLSSKRAISPICTSMSDDLAERLEILVHSAASATKKEDDRLRAQALACFGFQPAKTTPLIDIIFTRNRTRLNRRIRDGIQKSQGSQTRSQTRSQTKGRREEGSQPLATKKQHPKFSRRSTSRTAPTLRSSPDDFESILESTEFRRLISQDVETSISPFSLTPKQSPHSKSPAPHEANPPSSYATSRFDSWESSPTSIPDSQPLHYVPQRAILSSAILPLPEAEAEGPEPSVNTIFPTLSGVSFSYAPPAPTFNSLPEISPNLEDSYAFSEYSLSSLHSASYPASPFLPDFNPSFSLRTLIDGPCELFSPNPVTSSNPPLITCQLRKITAVGDGKLMVTKYQKLKKSQTRDLRMWERGYWNVDTSSWAEVKSKINFWNMLKDNVENGRLGQVSVFLDEDAIKVYCFGGMAEHLWCALFIMSSRNLENATWMDAADNEIIKF